MDTGPGWLPDPEHEGQERYWDGSRWTDQVRPVGSLRSLHLSDHVPELQRALAGSTADIDEVEDRLSTLFSRPGKPGGSRDRGGAVAGAVQRRPPVPAPVPAVVEPPSELDEEFDLALTAIDEVDQAMDKIVLELDDADEEPDHVDDVDVYDLDEDDDLDVDDEDEDMDQIVLDLDDADDDDGMDEIVLDLDDADADDADVADEVDDAYDTVDDVEGDDDDDAFAELDAALAAETPDEPDRRLFRPRS